MIVVIRMKALREMTKLFASHKRASRDPGRWIPRAASGVACVATILPMFRSGAWWIRMCDFPRLQVAFLAATAAAITCLLNRRGHVAPLDAFLGRAAQAALLAQMAHIAKYTRAFPKQVIRQKQHDPQRRVSLLSSNVRARNKNAQALLKLVGDRRPMVILLMEPNERWMKQLQPLERDYPHRVLQPQDNTYGMLLYSKLPLLNPEVRFLVQEDVPSIRCQLQLPSGDTPWFYAVHSRPPVRGNIDGELELEGSRSRDAELTVVASEIRELSEPVIVAGDFNDVAWSHTTRRFQRLGRLLDPRVGRGMFNTFHAANALFRFPLDHLFITEHFGLVSFGRERSIGSDHFPIYAEIELNTRAEVEQEPPATDLEDFGEAQRVLEEAATKT